MSFSKSSLLALLAGSNIFIEPFSDLVKPSLPYSIHEGNAGRRRKYKAKPRRQTWSFVSTDYDGSGVFCCRQTGEYRRFPITSTRGFSWFAKKYFGLKATY
jgi:hypothetical protein